MVNSLKVTVFDHRRNEIVNELRGHRNHIVSCAFLDGFDGIAFAGRGHRAKRVEDDGEGGPKHKDVRLIMATSGLDEVVIIWMVPYRKKTGATEDDLGELRPNHDVLEQQKETVRHRRYEAPPLYLEQHAPGHRVGEPTP